MRYFILPFVMFLLAGCALDDKRDVSLQLLDFGTAKYYEPFLWVKQDPPVVEREIVLNFNDYACENNAHVNLELVDKKLNKFNDNHKVELYLNNILCPNGKIRLNASDIPKSKKVKIGIKFNPGASKGRTMGYLVASQSDLDRIGDFDIKTDARIMKWEVRYKKTLNPLLTILLIFSSILFIWFIFFKRLIYPVFPKFKKLVKIGDTGLRTVVFTGYRKVVFTEKKIKQNLFEWLFIGKILFVLSPEFTNSIVFKPFKKNARAIDKNGAYRFSNNPIPRDGVTQIINLKSKTTINLN